MPPDTNPNKQPSDSMLALAIDEIRQKVTLLEAASKAEKPSTWRSSLFDLLKTLLSSWPSLMLLLLILFYGPLHSLLTMLPDKVKAANEVSFAGLSLKQQLEATANRIGNGELAKTIPKLSSQALAILLGTTQSVDINGLKFASPWIFSIPGLSNYQTDPIAAMFELSDAQLGQVFKDSKPITKAEYFAAPQKKGSELEMVRLTYTPTALGLQARDVILLSVARNFEQAPPGK